MVTVIKQYTLFKGWLFFKCNTSKKRGLTISMTLKKNVNSIDMRHKSIGNL